MIGDMTKGQCTGCKMCADVCPHGAITFETDEKGFWYPHIDKEKCTDCGLCEKKCPSLQAEQVPEGNEPVVWAAWSKDSTLRNQSTSGGVFYELARKIIENGGAVAGCRYGENYKSANHFLARTMEELECLCGSKYFQSDTEGIYKAVKEELKKGKEVLFCGTPCQNAAMSMYLGDTKAEIYYMDFICRSINSPLAFREYISDLEKEYGAKATMVHLKNKKTGWRSLATRVCFENGAEYHKDKNEDLWVKGFVGNDLYTRESCFECRYRTLPRKVSDITIGDFWGIAGESEYDMFQGISVLMLNTEKGKRLFERAKGSLYIREKMIEDVLPGNKALLQNPANSGKTEKFAELIKEKTFSEAVRQCIGEEKSTKKKHGPLYICRELKKDKKKYKNHGEISVLKYLFYNYCSKNVVRLGTAKLIPYKNAILDLDKTARIYVHGDKDFEIGINKLRGSKSETHVRMNDKALWNMHHGGALFYNTVVEVKENALLDTGFFTANGGSVIIVAKKVVLGEDVMLGRNIMIYDSDFHQLQNDCGASVNPAKEVVIENHVWLTSNVTVLKGVRIGQDSLITAQTVVNKNMPEHAIVAGKANGACIRDEVNWKRQKASTHEDVFQSSKIILYGYGILGRMFARKYEKQIECIIDNHVKKQGICTFDEFVAQNPEERTDCIWVVAAGQFMAEVKKDIRKKYPNATIYSVEV